MNSTNPELYDELPIVILENNVIYPGITINILSQNISIRFGHDLIHDVSGIFNKYVIFVTRNNSAVINPFEKQFHLIGKEIYNVGVIGKIIHIYDNYNDSRVTIEPFIKVKILKDKIRKIESFNLQEPKLCSYITNYEIYNEEENFIYSVQLDNLIANLFHEFANYIKINNHRKQFSLIDLIKEKYPIHKLIYIIATNIDADIQYKQPILENDDIFNKIKLLISLIRNTHTNNTTQLKILTKVKQQMEKTQKEYYLNEQIKVIQKELYGNEEGIYGKLEKRINKAKFPIHVKKKVAYELQKLKQINNTANVESAVISSYLEFLLELPWKTNHKKNNSIEFVRNTLNQNHYGMLKVKQRILEHLSVLHRTKKSQHHALCLVGPCGVGKTSLVNSIANSLSLKYGQIALGGLKDESELRGHRKTYVGAMPGRIMSTIHKLKSNTAVILLDEIDKISTYQNGKDSDPIFALLEILDSSQNKHFIDRYTDIEYDISQILFIATANSTNIHPALKDRLEFIKVEGYSDQEKFNIVKSHTLPKLIKEFEFKNHEISITNKAIHTIITYYTKESGIRELCRQLSKICRKVLYSIENKEITQCIIDNNIEQFLGSKKYHINNLYNLNKQYIGLTHGLAYTENGGDTLPIEAILLPGKGEIKLTGRLGKVMQESAYIAFNYIFSQLEKFNIDNQILREQDIHIHVPEGAVPKDGPSAGIALFCSIVSILTNTAVRDNIAMTGEMTLLGNVTVIGGIREKLLAAARSNNINTVIIPSENFNKLKEWENCNMISKLKIIPINHVSELLDIVFTDTINKHNYINNRKEKYTRLSV